MKGQGLNRNGVKLLRRLLLIGGFCIAVYGTLIGISRRYPADWRDSVYVVTTAVMALKSAWRTIIFELEWSADR